MKQRAIFFQVSEERLITLLEQINNQTTKQTKVTVSFHCLLPPAEFWYVHVLMVFVYSHYSSDTKASERS